MSDGLIQQLNIGVGIIFTLSLTALFVLMVVLWPRTRLNKLALWFMFWCTAVMWRWSVAVLKPEWLSIKESLLATVVFAGASVSTLIFAAVAWIEHVQDARANRP